MNNLESKAVVSMNQLCVLLPVAPYQWKIVASREACITLLHFLCPTAWLIVLWGRGRVNFLFYSFIAFFLSLFLSVHEYIIQLYHVVCYSSKCMYFLF
jgi:hypothetical protein